MRHLTLTAILAAAISTATAQTTNVGIGTASPAYKLSLSGSAASTFGGPHLAMYTSADAYPLFQQLNYTHDNITQTYDAYWDGAWRASSANSSFQLEKITNRMSFKYSSGNTPGTILTWNPSLTLLNNGNVGIGTASPNATLAVGGAVSMPYTGITASSYTISNADYFLAYTGTANASFYLPPAQSGAGNYRGRIYRIANYSGALVSVIAPANELIHGSNILSVPAATVVGIVNTGAVTGNTWMMTDSVYMPLLPTPSTTAQADVVRTILVTTSGTGAASVTKYDSIASGEWMEITAAEYNAMSSQLPGASRYGATNAQFASGVSSTTAFPCVYSGGSGGGSGGSGGTGYLSLSMDTVTQSKIPTGNYPVAIHVRTTNVAVAQVLFQNAHLLANSSALSGVYNNVGGNFTNWLTSNQTIMFYPYNTDVYCLQKADSFITTGPSYIAFRSPVPQGLVATVANAGSAMAYGISSPNYGSNGSNCPVSSLNYITTGTQGSYPLLQVLATPTKSW